MLVQLCTKARYVQVSKRNRSDRHSRVVGRLAQGLEPAETKYVLGGQACQWSEGINQHNFDARTWTNAAAVAERLWSAPPFSKQSAQPRNATCLWRRACVRACACAVPCRRRCSCGSPPPPPPPPPPTPPTHPARVPSHRAANQHNMPWAVCAGLIEHICRLNSRGYGARGVCQSANGRPFLCFVGSATPAEAWAWARRRKRNQLDRHLTGIARPAAGTGQTRSILPSAPPATSCPSASSKIERSFVLSPPAGRLRILPKREFLKHKSGSA